MENWLIRRSSAIDLQATRRDGVSERPLLTRHDSQLQNIVLMDTEQDATVEVHEVATAESLFILDGRYELSSPDPSESEIAGPGDLVYFPPGTAHGLRCVEGPGRFLVIFAPPKSRATE